MRHLSDVHVLCELTNTCILFPLKHPDDKRNPNGTSIGRGQSLGFGPGDGGPGDDGFRGNGRGRFRQSGRGPGPMQGSDNPILLSEAYRIRISSHDLSLHMCCT